MLESSWARVDIVDIEDYDRRYMQVVVQLSSKWNIPL
jgi:hypothetical protein